MRLPRHYVNMVSALLSITAFAVLTNKALHKPASQSTTYRGYAVADRAVDGDRNTVPSSSTWSGTEINNTESWLVVDLEEYVNVQRFEVTSRHCCREYPVADFTDNEWYQKLWTLSENV